MSMRKSFTLIVRSVARQKKYLWSCLGDGEIFFASLRPFGAHSTRKKIPFGGRVGWLATDGQGRYANTFKVDNAACIDVGCRSHVDFCLRKIRFKTGALRLHFIGLANATTLSVAPQNCTGLHSAPHFSIFRGNTCLPCNVNLEANTVDVPRLMRKRARFANIVDLCPAPGLYESKPKSTHRPKGSSSSHLTCILAGDGAADTARKLAHRSGILLAWSSLEPNPVSRVRESQIRLFSGRVGSGRAECARIHRPTDLAK